MRRTQNRGERGGLPKECFEGGNVMPKDEQAVLVILKSELEFIERGGYAVPGRQEAGSTMFADSLTCLNYGYPYRTQPCGECPLMEFVPDEKRSSAMPCHQIPLDSSGQTVEALEVRENQTGMQEAVKTWLRQMIHHMESRLPS